MIRQNKSRKNKVLEETKLGKVTPPKKKKKKKKLQCTHIHKVWVIEILKVTCHLWLCWLYPISRDKGTLEIAFGNRAGRLLK